MAGSLSGSFSGMSNFLSHFAAIFKAKNRRFFPMKNRKIPDEMGDFCIFLAEKFC